MQLLGCMTAVKQPVTYEPAHRSAAAKTDKGYCLQAGFVPTATANIILGLSKQAFPVQC